jgi:hypothetical protein
MVCGWTSFQGMCLAVTPASKTYGVLAVQFRCSFAQHICHLFASTLSLKHDKLDLDVIVSSDNLQLMPYKISWLSSSSPGEDPIKTQ